MADSTRFLGVGVALVTPFREDGSIHEADLEKLVDFEIDSGIDFLVPCGTTGENPALSRDEHLRVIEVVVRHADGRVPVLAGAGSNSTDTAIHFARASRDLGASGLLSITPYYNKPNPDGLLRHFAAQAKAVEGMPIVLYNVPGRTGVNMSASTTLRIAREIPEVVGVKEASANMEQILTIIRDREPGFLVLSGDDAWTLPLVAAGADGVVSVVANEVPALFKQMVTSALAGDFTAARTIHERLLPLMTGNFIESNPIPVKAAMKVMGLLSTDTVRSPLAPLAESNHGRIVKILAECGLT